MSSQTSSSRTEGFVRDVVEGSYVSPKYSGGRDDSDRKSDSQRATDTVDGGRRIKDSRKKQEYYRAHRLWSGKPLNIFTTDDFKEDVLASTVPPIWQKCEQDEIDRISMIPPRNAFEEMIRWTKDGILWKFPIDNEQDIGPEADIPFYEHVLLERHLHGFPDKPLIRQFMELVCTGLGRNPFWTVEQKVDHINWFRDYFNEKLSVFNETVQSGQIIATTPTSGSTAAVTAASAPPIKTTVPPVKTIVPPPKTTPSATVTTKK
ncbi:unnamed protein product [Didymodactylos carnosus]|nr:unnamed protein product [Didymodactylos carnosus]CAF3957129.1 unnamed protein product [Didymodactylos carnosus]